MAPTARRISRSLHPNKMSIRSAVFTQPARVTDRHTDWQTPESSIAIVLMSYIRAAYNIVLHLKANQLYRTKLYQPGVVEGSAGRTTQ